MFVMFFNVVFSMFVCYSAAFCQLCFYNKDWIGDRPRVPVDYSQFSLGGRAMPSASSPRVLSRMSRFLTQCSTIVWA